MLIQMIELSKKEKNTINLVTALKTILVIVENAQGDIDNIMPQVIDLLMQQLTYFCQRKRNNAKVTSMLI